MANTPKSKSSLTATFKAVTGNNVCKPRDVLKLSLSKITTDLNDCKTLCDSNYYCVAITFYTQDNYCAIYNNFCDTPFKELDNREVFRAIRPAVKLDWIEVGRDIECDAGAGEVYLQSSSKRPSLDDCRQSCQDQDGCKSISYFPSKWCGHFGTSCTLTKTITGAISMRLGAVPTTACAAFDEDEMKRANCDFASAKNCPNALPGGIKKCPFDCAPGFLPPGGDKTQLYMTCDDEGKWHANAKCVAPATPKATPPAATTLGGSTCPNGYSFLAPGSHLLQVTLTLSLIVLNLFLLD